mmetsp:Transcript_16767/g.30381  ORF Transcript_16767/g.30381 Transcript_16767/m.30381 type:complete len:284 (+) Transcript_16767:1979-2830(+)
MGPTATRRTRRRLCRHVGVDVRRVINQAAIITISIDSISISISISNSGSSMVIIIITIIPIAIAGAATAEVAEVIDGVPDNFTQLRGWYCIGRESIFFAFLFFVFLFFVSLFSFASFFPSNARSAVFFLLGLKTPFLPSHSPSFFCLLAHVSRCQQLTDQSLLLHQLLLDRDQAALPFGEGLVDLSQSLHGLGQTRHSSPSPFRAFSLPFSTPSSAASFFVFFRIGSVADESSAALEGAEAGAAVAAAAGVAIAEEEEEEEVAAAAGARSGKERGEALTDAEA